jgi:hypothetical protein
MNHRIALTFLVPFVLSACTALNLDVMWRISQFKEKVAKEIIVVEQPFYEESPDKVWSFFRVYMLVEPARKMEAPSGEEFLQLLDVRVTEYERRNGRKMCSHGYNVNSRKPDVRDYSRGDLASFWLITVDCNP